jgi:GTP-binding protein
MRKQGEDQGACEEVVTEMNLPVVAIVGRPNVGKSSLFNWLAGRRIAIVEPTAGVTRDRVSTIVRTDSRSFELTDTGGMGIQDSDNLTAEVERQIEFALEQAHLILFVVDGRAGVAPLDELVAERLRLLNKPVLCVANKCDYADIEPQATDFYRLGYDQVLPVSAQNNRGKKELIDWIERHLPDEADLEPQEVALKLAIVGRRNTGKSTFINSLAQAERMIVSEVPGTTRDSVDVRFERDGKVYLAIDTAGVRKKKSLANDIEWYSMTRAERSIRRADVVLHFHDPRFRVSKVDKQLAGYILENYKPAIFVVNKWDLVKSDLATGDFAHYLTRVFPGLNFVPFAFITAKSGKNVQAVLNLAQNLYKQASARVSTSDLNRVLREAILRNEPPLRQNRRAKIYFATQAAANPPTIVLFTNGPELIDHAYERYLLNEFRDALPFKEVPIKLVLRHRSSERREDVPDRDVSLEELPASDPLVAAAEPPAPERKPAGKRKKKPGPKPGQSSQLWRDV